MTEEVAPSLEQMASPTLAERSLRMLVVTSSYAPDRTGMAPINTELCEYLVSRGHQVSVLTCFPHYPEWKIPPAYRGKLWQRETLNGVSIFRSYAYIPPRRTTLRRILYDTSIGLSAALRGLLVGKVDLVLAVSPPLQAGLAGSFLARLKRVPLLLEIQDLVPDLAIAVGMLRNSKVIKLARILESYVYRRADGILAISEGFVANLSSKGVPKSKLSFIPLWVDSKLISPCNRYGPFRKTHGISETQTVVLYTGNLGAKQKLENVLAAAARLRPPLDVLFLFVGDGTEKEHLQRYARERALSNVRFLPLLPPEPKSLLPQMLAAADLLVLNQSAQVVDTVIPSKLFAYMSAGRPVVAAVNPSSEAAACIRRADSGLTVDPEDPIALAEAICKLKEDKGLAERLGRHGRLFVEENCARDRIFNEYEIKFLTFANNESAPAVLQGTTSVLSRK